MRNMRRSEPSPKESIRLSTNDNQDRAAALRRQIAQTQQEQREFQAKAARLAALQRDMADMERYLQPFTAPGYLQPKSDRNAWDTERTVEKPNQSHSLVLNGWEHWKIRWKVLNGSTFSAAAKIRFSTIRGHSVRFRSTGQST